MKGPEDEALLKKRLEELARRAEGRGGRTFSEFLDMAGQETLSRISAGAPVECQGGWPGAERRVACFGLPEEWEEELPFGGAPIVCLRLTAAAPKFAKKLTHRDCLGALMGLGIRREVLGDILIDPDGMGGWIFCLESMGEHIASQLAQAGSTAVRAVPAPPPPELASALPPESVVQAASARLDALVAGVYGLSRAESGELFRRGLVYINSRLPHSPSDEAREGDTVSVRGRGRFIYAGPAGETRSGRLKARVRVF